MQEEEEIYNVVFASALEHELAKEFNCFESWAIRSQSELSKLTLLFFLHPLLIEFMTHETTGFLTKKEYLY